MKKWKNRAEGDIDRSWWREILTDFNCAEDYPIVNRIVYAQLSVATSEGTSQNIMK